MGLFDFLKPKSALEKAAKQVREEYAQPDYRRGAADKLFEIGTEEAYDALLKRFSVTANARIADEQEKRDLVDDLVRVGEPVVPALKRYVSSEKASLALPILALSRILEPAELKAFLLEVLTGYEPMDHRSTRAKAALVDAIAELVGPDEAAVLYPYLGDHHDDVQVAVLHAIERVRPRDAAEALAGVCGSELHSGRIKRESAKTLSQLALPVRDRYADFDDELKATWILGKKGQLVPRPHA